MVVVVGGYEGERYGERVGEDARPAPVAQEHGPAGWRAAGRASPGRHVSARRYGRRRSVWVCGCVGVRVCGCVCGGVWVGGWVSVGLQTRARAELGAGRLRRAPAHRCVCGCV